MPAMLLRPRAESIAPMGRSYNIADSAIGITRTPTRMPVGAGHARDALETLR